MPKRKYSRYNTKSKRMEKSKLIEKSKLLEKKISLEVIPKKTITITLYALRWFFFLVFLFITIGIITLFLTSGKIYTQMILIYSITGFFTFFMGYLGWIIAQGVMNTLSKNEDTLKESIPYYISDINK
ncbi:MAG: hypothetical protein MUO82_03125 [Candidatus Thermoplasmatota archaeon]|nr:hypothetical protein [Candidatus Thermoplasmatota archaeon]